MKRQFIQPDALFPSGEFGFSQVVTTEGGRWVHCAGQTAWDKDMNLIGEGDLAVQMEASLENVRLALAAGGAQPSDVVRTKVYIVGYDPEQLSIIGPAMTRFFGTENPPASTLLGVQSLAMPGFLVEIEATAIVEW